MGLTLGAARGGSPTSLTPRRAHVRGARLLSADGGSLGAGSCQLAPAAPRDAGRLLGTC